jgi:hypothetical protein
MMALADNFGGAAAASAQTAAGKFKILKNSLDETKESIGAALLPVLQKVLPYLQAMADWAQRNPKAFLYIAGTISAVAAAIVTMNIAMALTPFGAIAIAIGVVTSAMIYLEQKTNALSESWGRFGAVLRIVLGPLYDVVALAGKLGLIDKISIPSFTPTVIGGGAVSNLPPALRYAPTPTISLPSMPTVTTPIVGGGGGGGGGRAGGGGGGGGVGGGGDLVTIQGALTEFGMAERIAARGSGGVTINVTGGMSTSAEIGQSVLNSLLAYQRTNGPLDLQIAS